GTGGSARARTAAPVPGFQWEQVRGGSMKRPGGIGGIRMHLLEAWTTLGPFHLARLLALPGAVLVATLLPGRVLARGASLVCAASVLLLDEMAVPWWARATWVLLWLAVASQAGLPERSDLLPRPPGRRGFAG